MSARHRELYELVHGYLAGQLVALAAEDPEPEVIARLDVELDAAMEALAALPTPTPEECAALIPFAQEAARLTAAVAVETRQRRDELTAQHHAQERARGTLDGYLPPADTTARYIDRRW